MRKLTNVNPLKYLWTILFLIFHFGLFAQQKAIIGMTMNEVRKIYPKITIDPTDDSTLTRPEKLYGLDVDWGYRFKGMKLTWIYFEKYIDNMDDSNFQVCLFATKQLIKDYTKLYGKPDSTIIGDTIFINPYFDRHWGYDVMEARWKSYKGMKMSIRFTFFGGKGEYHFIVSMKYYDKAHVDYN